MESILDKLFESTAKARLLKLFLMNPEREFVMPEIVKQTQLKKPAVQKELAKLLKFGLVRTMATKVAKKNKRKQKLTKETKRKLVSAKTVKVNRKRTKIAKEAKATKVVKTKKKQKSKKR